MPAPRNDLRLVLTDEYGQMFADPQGYAWRGPEYEPRYAELHAKDHLQAGGWTKIGDWYKSRSPLAEYAPSSAEQLYDKLLKPGEDGTKAVQGIAGLVVLGGLIYFGAQVAPALINARAGRAGK